MTEYIELLRKKLTPNRFIHSKNVSFEAVRIAKKYGADVKKAEFAGLIHDIMKDTPKPLLEKTVKCLNPTKLEEGTPKLWHAMAGAWYIKSELGVNDEDIINAVRYHTTAREQMSLLEKVIYLADFTSEERDYNGVEEMRAAVDESLEKAMREALVFTIGDLLKSGNPIHPDTLYAYNEIVLKG